ncbi:hypothetical protein B0H11DRAFT_2213941 [Mycena galericulata]|nr:hypothetical protein B0H11DRAFT_2213941 [Mycena galericulata]
MPRLNARWLSFFAASIAVLFTLVAVVGYESYQEGTKEKNKLNAYGVDTSGNLALAMVLTIDSFDPSEGSTALGFHLDFFPINNLDLVAENGTLQAPAVPVRLLLQSVTSNFAAQTVMPSQTITQILDGDVNRYPLDVYTIDYKSTPFLRPAMLPRRYSIRGQDDGSGVNISITMSRSPITKAFSVVTILVMWCLSGSVFITAMSVFFREYKAELPLVALSTALLFAFPNVRNSQPGIPAVAGTTSDMVGFFFNLLLVARLFAFGELHYQEQKGK